MKDKKQHQNSDRLVMPDIGRAIALIGIAVVNVSVIAVLAS
ncbi:MAG: hypothetical protein V7744_20400 [Pseudomonadales bacterium]